MKRRFLAIFLCVVPGSAAAHDNWIEPGTSQVLGGSSVSLSLMLGNHGNRHRDFKLASKVDPSHRSLRVLSPSGRQLDLVRTLVDMGSTTKEGYWTANYAPTETGLHMAVSTFDQVMSYAPVRDIKTAKTYFLVGAEGRRRSRDFGRAVGTPFEIVPLTEPVGGARKSRPFPVRVLYKGRPVAGVTVSFVPKGSTPKGEFDSRFQKVTGADGRASIVLRESNIYLVSAHLADRSAKGKGYESINYSATICLRATSAGLRH